MNLSEEKLNTFPKEAVIALYISLQNEFSKIEKQNEELMKKVDRLQESINVLVQQRYGRKSESNVTDGQLSFDFNNSSIINEAEVLTENGIPEEPTAEETITYNRKKHAGKREADLKDIVEIDEAASELSEEELRAEFPDGYTRLPDEIYKELHYSPAQFEVHVKHIAVYRGKKTNKVIKAKREPRLMPHSLVTPSLFSAVMNAKFVNAVPINRFSEELKRFGINISRQVLAGWMIKISERYFSMLYDEMHKQLFESKLIHCDETPFRVIHNGLETDSKSYMWVYHTHPDYGGKDIYLYDYRSGRSADHPRAFLKEYKGILMTDGYQVYHKLQKERPEELTVAGCWAHAKRRFATLCKANGKGKSKGSVAADANDRIAAFYHVDNMRKGCTPDEILKNRTNSVRPMVDDFFAWIKEVYTKIDHSSETGKAINYCINQEAFLRAFLNDPIIPLDNNDAERSIKKFVIGRKNWLISDTVRGAESSAVLYSIAETAKANGLKPYYYFKYVLEEMPKYIEDSDRSFIQDLLPWSDKLSPECYSIR